MDESMGCGVIILMVPEIGRIAGMLNLATAHKKPFAGLIAQQAPIVFQIVQLQKQSVISGHRPVTYFRTDCRFASTIEHIIR